MFVPPSAHPKKRLQRKNSTQDTHDHDQHRIEGKQVAGTEEGGHGRSDRGLSYDPKTIT